jgi:transmembrane sensor
MYKSCKEPFVTTSFMPLNDDYILLLHKSFSGEISGEEAAQLQEWIKQSPDNQRLAQEMRLVWEKSSQYSPWIQADVDADFALLQKRIQVIDLQRPKIVPLSVRLMRIAAVAVLLIGAFWAGRHFFGNTALTHMEYANNGQKRQLELPDGTKVWLNADASLEYPLAFEPNERRVKLIGEAFFEVAHNPAQPFKVQLPNGGIVEVLGTQFDVKALPGAEQTSVLVRSGKVRFSPDGQHQGTLLLAGQKAVFERSSSRVQVRSVTTFNELAWQTGGLEFVHVPLKTVISDLQDHYQVKISLLNADLNQCTYTAPLTSQPIEKVLKSIALTYGMRLKQLDNGQFELSEGACQ